MSKFNEWVCSCGCTAWVEPTTAFFSLLAARIAVEKLKKKERMDNVVVKYHADL